MKEQEEILVTLYVRTEDMGEMIHSGLHSLHEILCGDEECMAYESEQDNDDLN